MAKSLLSKIGLGSISSVMGAYNKLSKQDRQQLLELIKKVKNSSNQEQAVYSILREKGLKDEEISKQIEEFKPQAKQGYEVVKQIENL